MTSSPIPAPAWLRADDCSLEDFRTLVEQSTDADRYPHAECVRQNVPVYDGTRLGKAATAEDGRGAVQGELVDALLDGPGIVVLQGAFEDTKVVDRATAAFEALIEQERQTAQERGDHFAAPGANDRVWNAMEKLATAAPDVFADYYANDLLALASEAWLGPGYQITSQVNVVKPGGAAQRPHRDYHLGFLTNTQAAAYPAHVHRLSPVLTLQGAVAHGDMPVESGPTMYLPHSQKYEAGYLAWRRPEFIDYFDQHHIQLPLHKGDAVFFNPALFHGAGHNRTPDTNRMANLLQVSSAFGRAMETVDTETMSRAVYPVLQRHKSAGMDGSSLRNVIAATAEGYPFPTNLDQDPPVDGLAPASQADLVWQALEQDRTPDELQLELRAHTARRRSN